MISEPAPTGGVTRPTGPTASWGRLRSAVTARPDRAQVLLAALLFGLGFAVVTQVQQASDLSGLRQSDLVRVLDDVSQRRVRLEGERADLEDTLQGLTSASGREAEARAVADTQRDTYSILAGTSPAVGPGVRMTVIDPDNQVRASILLDAIQELRDAGAEAIQVADVRVVASTTFVQVGNDVQVGGEIVRAPFEILAIGDSSTIDTALRIPGGVYESITRRPTSGTAAELSIVTDDEVLIDAVLPLEEPGFLAPDDQAGP